MAHDYYFFKIFASISSMNTLLFHGNILSYHGNRLNNANHLSAKSENQNDFCLRSFTTYLICSWINFCGRITLHWASATRHVLCPAVSQQDKLVVGLVNRYSHVFRSDTNFQTLFCFCSCCLKCSFILYQTGIMDVTTRWRLS